MPLGLCLQRNELDAMYNNGVGELYDLGETRRALQARRSELLAECTANSRLQQRFDEIAAQLSGGKGGASTSVGGSGGERGGAGMKAVPTEPVSFPSAAARMSEEMDVTDLQEEHGQR